jgi:hypothetical protein
MDATLKEDQLQVSPELLHVERTALFTVLGVQNPRSTPKQTPQTRRRGMPCLLFPVSPNQRDDVARQDGRGQALMFVLDCPVIMVGCFDDEKNPG